MYNHYYLFYSQMANKKKNFLVYITLLTILLLMSFLYLALCRCKNCESSTVVADHQLTSFYRQGHGLGEEEEQSLTNVEALNEHLHRALQDQQTQEKDGSHVNGLTSRQTLSGRNTEHLPTLFIVTPTYKRWTQKADLTRFCQTIMHIKNLEWIVVEDSAKKSMLVSSFLDRCSVSSVHLLQKTSVNFTNEPIKTEDGKVYYGVKKPRGIEQRNRALEWIRQTYKHRNVKGVVFFADDDNTYDLRIFEEMRNTKKVSVWPVGLVGGLKYEGPKCSKDKVTGWYSYWATDRMFRIDFAGFAVNVNLIIQSNHIIPLNSKPGYVEDAFLRQFVSVEDLEPKAERCTKVFVWHTRTEKPSMLYENQLIRLGKPSNKDIEV